MSESMDTPQQVINIGEAPNDGTGEALRDAFAAVNNNFANIWAAGPVNSQVVISNNWISTNQYNLDLFLAGNALANINLYSNVLSKTFLPLTDSGYDLGSPGQYWDSTYSRYYYGNGAFLTGITTVTNTISSGNSNVTIDQPNGPVTIGVDGVSNVAVFGTENVEIGANLVPSLTNLDIGNVTNPFQALWISNAGINVGQAQITANADSIIITNPQGGQFVINNTGTDFPYNDGNVVVLLQNLTTPISTTGNITAANFVGNVIGNISGNITVPGANTEVVFNDNGTANASPAFTFDKTANTLTVTGQVSATGNISGSYLIGNGVAISSIMADRGGDPNNWNTLTQMGVYAVNRSSWSGTVGTPLDSQVFVGLLEVKNSSDLALEQIFYPGTIEGGNVKVQWNRNYWSGSWTAWIKIVNDEQVVSGGTY